MAAKKKKKLKLRVDRVIIAAVACLIILFGLYKGISFAVSLSLIHIYKRVLIQ